MQSGQHSHHAANVGHDEALPGAMARMLKNDSLRWIGVDREGQTARKLLKASMRAHEKARVQLYDDVQRIMPNDIDEEAHPFKVKHFRDRVMATRTRHDPEGQIYKKWTAESDHDPERYQYKEWYFLVSWVHDAHIEEESDVKNNCPYHKAYELHIVHTDSGRPIEKRCFTSVYVWFNLIHPQHLSVHDAAANNLEKIMDDTLRPCKSRGLLAFENIISNKTLHWHELEKHAPPQDELWVFRQLHTAKAQRSRVYEQIEHVWHDVIPRPREDAMTERAEMLKYLHNADDKGSVEYAQKHQKWLEMIPQLLESQPICKAPTEWSDFSTHLMTSHTKLDKRSNRPQVFHHVLLRHTLKRCWEMHTINVATQTQEWFVWSVPTTALWKDRDTTIDHLSRITKEAAIPKARPVIQSTEEIRKVSEEIFDEFYTYLHHYVHLPWQVMKAVTQDEGTTVNNHVMLHMALRMTATKRCQRYKDLYRYYCSPSAVPTSVDMFNPHYDKRYFGRLPRSVCWEHCEVYLLHRSDFVFRPCWEIFVIGYRPGEQPTHVYDAIWCNAAHTVSEERVQVLDACLSHIQRRAQWSS